MFGFGDQKNLWLAIPMESQCSLGYVDILSVIGMSSFKFSLQKKFRRVKQISDEEDSEDEDGNLGTQTEVTQRDAIAKEIFQEDLDEGEDDEPVSFGVFYSIMWLSPLYLFIVTVPFIFYHSFICWFVLLSVGCHISSCVH